MSSILKRSSSVIERTGNDFANYDFFDEELCIPPPLPYGLSVKKPQTEIQGQKTTLPTLLADLTLNQSSIQESQSSLSTLADSPESSQREFDSTLEYRKSYLYQKHNWGDFVDDLLGKLQNTRAEHEDMFTKEIQNYSSRSLLRPPSMVRRQKTFSYSRPKSPILPKTMVPLTLENKPSLRDNLLWDSQSRKLFKEAEQLRAVFTKELEALRMISGIKTQRMVIQERIIFENLLDYMEEVSAKQGLIECREKPSSSQTTSAPLETKKKSQKKGD